MPVSLRKRIADSPWFNRAVEAALAAWIRISYRTSSWERIGYDELAKAVSEGGPVIVCLWHQRLMMAPYLFDASLGPICTLTSGARAGRLAGKVVERFGLGTIAMSSHTRHIALSREVLGRIRDGASVGIAADGPRGPARVSSGVPIAWARASQKRVFVLSYSARRVIEVPTWDRMWFPVPWTRGVLMAQEWTADIQKQVTPERAEELRFGLQAALDEVTDASDRAAGRGADH